MSQEPGAQAPAQAPQTPVELSDLATLKALAHPRFSARVREFALLRLAGATRRQVFRMLRTETLSVLLLATVLRLGSGIALAVLTGFSIGMTGGAAPAVTPLVYITVVAGAALLALVATAVPGRVALTPRPVTAATAKE